MSNPAHTAMLLDIIAEQRTRIANLETELEDAKNKADRNWRWYLEEEEKVKKLSGELVVITAAADKAE